MWVDDQPGSINRGLVRATVDGQPPYDRGEIARNGQLQRCNINWLTARSALNNARALYVDLVNSVPILIQPNFNGDIDPADAQEWGAVIAEGFTRLIRNWPQWPFQLDQLIDQFVGYGVGFACHESMRDWRWISLGLGDVLFPRSTKADEEHVEIVMMRRAYFPYELIDAVRDKKVAADKGWNIEGVIDAVMYKAQGNDPRIGNDYEQLEREMFESTFYYSYASKIDMIWTDHLYTRESDGTYTHQITLTEKVTDDKGNPKANQPGFLFEKISEFDNISDFFTIFPNGGGNGDIHGQRGILFDIFPQTQAINQIQCEMVDNVRLSCSMLLQCGSEEALSDLGMIDLGPFKVLPPKVNLVETQLNAPTQDALSTLGYLTNQQSSNTGQYSPMSTNDAIGEAQTGQQGRMVAANQNILSQSQANVFYAKLTHLMNRVFRRAARDDWQAGEPGGREALAFQKWLYSRGVPLPTEELNVLGSVSDVEVVRAIGYGSPANRMSVQSQLATLAGSMSPEAQNEYARYTVTALTDTRMANLLFPRMSTKPSEVQDQTIAGLENGLLRLGQQVAVSGNNLIHATSHTAAIVQMMQEALQGKVQPQAIVTFLQPAIQHTQQHVELLAKDNINQKKAPEFTPILTQANALMQKAMSIQQRNDAQSAKLGQQNDAVQQQEDPTDPTQIPLAQARVMDTLSKIDERKQKLALEQQKFQVEAQTKVAKTAHNDAALASKINFESQRNGK